MHGAAAEGFGVKRRRVRLVLMLALASMLGAGNAWAQFDHKHAAWDVLLKKHVRWLADHRQSRVDYAGLRADRDALARVLDAYSAVPAIDFEGWTKPQQMAFLINAYNAYTIALVLRRYPDLKSIKDLGSLIESPWRKKFFTLLGEPRHLDWIEHDQLRRRYRDWRIHAASGASRTCSRGTPASKSSRNHLKIRLTCSLPSRARLRVRSLMKRSMPSSSCASSWVGL